MAESFRPETPSGAAWLRRFRTRYDESASDPITELGVFYERYRDFVVYEKHPESRRVEYTDSEWTQVLSVFLSRLAREFGLYQTWEWNGRRDLAWFRPGETWRLSAVVAQENEADDGILASEIPVVLANDAELAVVIMYPDYPPPSGASTVEAATEAWRGRVERVLRELQPRSQFLLLTISANSWEIPAPWKGFVWNPTDQRLVPVD